MFRTLYVAQGEKITVRDNWLLVTKKEEVVKVPLEDLQTVIVDNAQTLLSVHTLQCLAEKHVNTVICGSSRLPCCTVLPVNGHYRPFGVLKKQLALTEVFKSLLWQRVVKAKLENQKQALVLKGAPAAVTNRMGQLAAEVLPGDCGNREAIAAKMYFKAFYGLDFMRFEDDVVNAALNYGYAIIRSAVARSLCAYGYNCALGIHHISETNAFNLADDFMEPLRPLVDLWAWQHNEELLDELTKNNKMGLADILNNEIMLGGKRMKVYNAIDKYIGSIGTAIDSNDVNKLLLPRLDIDVK